MRLILEVPGVGPDILTTHLVVDRVDLFFSFENFEKKKGSWQGGRVMTTCNQVPLSRGLKSQMFLLISWTLTSSSADRCMYLQLNNRLGNLPLVGSAKVETTRTAGNRLISTEIFRHESRMHFIKALYY